MRSLPFLVLMNSMFIGIPVAIVATVSVGNRFGLLAGIVTGLLTFNLAIVGMYWGLDNGT